MKRLPIFLILLLVSSAALAQGSKYRAEYEKEKNGPRGECPVEWVPMQSGIDYRTIRCLGGDELDLHVVRVDTRRWRLNTAVVGGANARTIASQTDAAFVLNANFFDKARKPEGVVVRSGESLQGARSSSWQSIFYVTESGRARIVLPSKWSSVRKNAWMAVQAGPRLVIDGHTNTGLRNNYAAPRAGVCIQWDDDLLFFAMPADRKLHIKEMAKVARRAEIDGGLACKDAMLFDGGHSVNFFVDGTQRDVTINQDPVPVYVYAQPR